MTKRPRPPLGTQHRTVFDFAEEWHEQRQHQGDVRVCIECRRTDVPVSERTPYGVALRMFFAVDGEPRDPRLPVEANS